MNATDKPITIVVMVSDTLITFTDGTLNPKAMDKIAFLLSNLHNSDKNVVLVTAGAMALGVQKINMKERPKSLNEKQAIAAIGQVELMKAYQKHFNEFSKTIAQVLVTRKVILLEDRKERASDTLHELFNMGIIPIINENDSVSTADIELEDNYPLAADVARLINADFIVVTSDILGRYNVIKKNDNRANIIESDEDLFELLNTPAASKNPAVAESFPAHIHQLVFPGNE